MYDLSKYQSKPFKKPLIPLTKKTKTKYGTSDPH